MKIVCDCSVKSGPQYVLINIYTNKNAFYDEARRKVIKPPTCIMSSNDCFISEVSYESYEEFNTLTERLIEEYRAMALRKLCTIAA